MRKTDFFLGILILRKESESSFSRILRGFPVA